MWKTCSLAIAALVPALVQAQEGYLCVSDKSTGFKREADKKWVHSRFKTDGEKFLLAKKAGKWKWAPFGVEESFGQCGEINEGGYLHCSNFFEEVVFNSKNLRFQLVYQGGYISEGVLKSESADTPFITIGTCARF